MFWDFIDLQSTCVSCLVAEPALDSNKSGLFFLFVLFGLGLLLVSIARTVVVVGESSVLQKFCLLFCLSLIALMQISRSSSERLEFWLRPNSASTAKMDFGLRGTPWGVFSSP